MPLFGLAQATFHAGYLPKINLTTKLSPRTRLITGVESRFIHFERPEEKDRNIQYVLTDFSLAFSRKFGYNGTLNAGYTFRERSGAFVHRLSQQYNVVQNFDAARIGHRFAFDQTWSGDQDITLRLRYRLTLEKPLSGDKIDSNEFYLKVGNEYLGIFDTGGDLEIRLIPAVGYELNRQNKLEVGLDYRLSAFLGPAVTDHQLWSALSWFCTF